jgi:hypothetical protein
MNTGPAANAATGTDTPPPSDTDAVVSRVEAIVQELEALFPNLIPHDPRQIRRVVHTARFARDLIVPTIATARAVAIPAGLFDADAARKALETKDKLGPALQRLSVFTGNLSYTLDEEVSKGGEGCLQTYKWAKRSVSGGRRTDLQPYVDEMSRVVKKTLNKGRPATPSPNPAPSPGGPTPPPSGAQTLLAIRRPAALADDDEPLELPESWYAALADE